MSKIEIRKRHQAGQPAQRLVAVYRQTAHVQPDLDAELSAEGGVLQAGRRLEERRGLAVGAALAVEPAGARRAGDLLPRGDCDRG